MAATLIIAAFGLVAGSFLSLCAWRLPRGESVNAPGSRCRACGVGLRTRDNVPLLSYAWLRGRCRGCHAAIGWRYPAIEAATALAWIWAWRRSGGGIAFLREAIFLSFLIVLAATDAETRQLPDEITLGGWAAALVLSLSTAPGWRSAVAASFGLAGALALVAWVYERRRGRAGMGWGDIKMLGLLGAFLGWRGGLVAVFLASIAAAAAGLLLIAGALGAGARRHAGVVWSETALPFGVFLAAGGVATLAWGGILWRLWMG